MRKLVLVALALVVSAPAVRRGAEVHIRFSGVICHVFDGTHAPRAVAVRGGGTMLHHAVLHMPQSSVASSEVAMTCDNGDCLLELADTAIRFLGSGRPQFAESFDTVVPHLRAVTNGEMSALRHDAFDTMPSPNGVVSAVMELPAGRMSAAPFDTKARYEPDFENRGERVFPREVALDGVVAAPVLLVRRAGDKAWRSITFRDDIELRMVNEPAMTGMMPMQHEMLFYDLAAQPLTTKPLILLPAGSVQPSTFAAGCSDSQWP
jgi:hypothetical protein